jgi:hypothetical protein
MAVTAKFVPDRIESLPNATTAITLRLYNDDASPREVTLSASGDLVEHVHLEQTSATIDTNQIVDIAVTVRTPSNVPAGSYRIGADVASTTDTTATESEPPLKALATATVELAEQTDYSITLQPERSRGAKRGRHILRVINTGNTLITLDLSSEHATTDLSVELDRAALSVAGGESVDVAVRVVPTTTYWSGPTRDHDFTLRATSADGRHDELSGAYEQRSRVPNWLGPAAAGAVAALLVGALVWFTVLRPWVQDTADDAAAEAIERDRAALAERIEELEVAAAEAQELPLGRPTDIRLEVDPAGGNVEQASATPDPGTLLSITDVVFQNPTGAVGTVSLRRGDEVILQSELANFRDFDLHFVAPFQFGDDDEVVLDVDCRTPGAGASTCPVAVSLVGFVDETD